MRKERKIALFNFIIRDIKDSSLFHTWQSSEGHNHILLLQISGDRISIHLMDPSLLTHHRHICQTLPTNLTQQRSALIPINHHPLTPSPSPYRPPPSPHRPCFRPPLPPPRAAFPQLNQTPSQREDDQSAQHGDNAGQKCYGADVAAQRSRTEFPPFLVAQGADGALEDGREKWEMRRIWDACRRKGTPATTAGGP